MDGRDKRGHDVEGILITKVGITASSIADSARLDRFSIRTIWTAVVLRALQRIPIKGRSMVAPSRRHGRDKQAGYDELGSVKANILARRTKGTPVPGPQAPWPKTSATALSTQAFASSGTASFGICVMATRIPARTARAV